MCEADHNFLDALLAGPLNQLIHRRDKTFSAFEGKSLLANVFGVQIPFETFGCGQALENPGSFLGGKLRLGPRTLEALLQPTTMRLIVEMHDFSADRPAIGLT